MDQKKRQIQGKELLRHEKDYQLNKKQLAFTYQTFLFCSLRDIFEIF